MSTTTSTTSTSGATGRTLRVVSSLLLDALLITVFAALGREQHDSGPPLTGAVETAWPFLIGAAVGWVIWWALRRSAPESLLAGALVWVSSVVGGMALRALTGQGTALAFVLVTIGVLGAFLLGWRLVALGVRRYRARG